MVVSGAPAVFGLFAARDIWKLRAKIAPENESTFECDAGAKMSKFEAPIDVIGSRGSLNKGEIMRFLWSMAPESKGNTAAALAEVGAALEGHGIEWEVFQLGAGPRAWLHWLRQVRRTRSRVRIR